MRTNLRHFVNRLSLLMGLLTIVSVLSFGQRGNETIDATAFGTSTQMGRTSE